MLRLNLSQEYDCPAFGSDSDIHEPNLVHHGQKFHCTWCGGEHTAGVDVQISTIRDWRDYPELPASAEELQALINEDETPKITTQELHALRKQLATYQAREALGLVPKAPHAPVTASIMRDDGGDAPAFCLMAAYRSEADVQAACARLGVSISTSHGGA